MFKAKKNDTLQNQLPLGLPKQQYNPGKAAPKTVSDYGSTAEARRNARADFRRQYKLAKLNYADKHYIAKTIKDTVLGTAAQFAPSAAGATAAYAMSAVDQNIKGGTSPKTPKDDDSDDENDRITGDGPGYYAKKYSSSRRDED